VAAMMWRRWATVQNLRISPGERLEAAECSDGLGLEIILSDYPGQANRSLMTFFHTPSSG
jgi:hypothetical protein